MYGLIICEGGISMEIEVKSRRSRKNLFVTHTYGFIDLYVSYIGVDGIGWLTILETLVDRTGNVHNVNHYGLRKLAKKYKMSQKRIVKLNKLLEEHGLIKIDRGDCTKRNVYYLLDPVEDEASLSEIVNKNKNSDSIREDSKEHKIEKTEQRDSLKEVEGCFRFGNTVII